MKTSTISLPNSSFLALALWIHDDDARLIASYDAMRRSATLTAGPYYGTMAASFLPDDPSGHKATAQLGADKDGASLDVTRGDATKTYK